MGVQVDRGIGGGSPELAEGRLRKLYGQVPKSGHRIQPSERDISILYYGGGSLELRRLHIQVCRR
jgi:hypothetical protein